MNAIVCMSKRSAAHTIVWTYCVATTDEKPAAWKSAVVLLISASLRQHWSSTMTSCPGKKSIVVHVRRAILSLPLTHVRATCILGTKPLGGVPTQVSLARCKAESVRECKYSLVRLDLRRRVVQVQSPGCLLHQLRVWSTRMWDIRVVCTLLQPNGETTPTCESPRNLTHPCACASVQYKIIRSSLTAVR